MRRIRSDHAGRPASFPFIALLVLIAVLAAACASGGAAPDSFGGQSRTEPPAEPAPGGGDGGVERPAIGLVDDARIVRTGTMELEVTDVNRAVSAGRDAIRGLGGYIGASSTSNYEDGPIALITYRIPVDRWEEALAALRSLNGLTSKVVVEQTAAVEVTGQIIDLEARIRNLRASESALQAISAKAGKISDVLEVQAQLTQVRGEIEQLTAQLTEVSQRADYATLEVTFGTAVVATQLAARGWDPATVVDEATASLVEILQGLAGVGIWFAIVGLPVLVTVTIVGLILAAVLRRLRVRGPAAPLPPASPPPSSPPPPPDPLAAG